MKIKQTMIQLIMLLGFMLMFSWFNIKTSVSFDKMVGFMSISIGFSVTALSVVASSKFSRTLYERQGLKNNQTQLHELITLFKQANFFFLLNIVLIFIYSWFSQDWLNEFSLVVKEKNLNIGHFLEAVIWTILCVSLKEFYKLFNLFCAYIIQEAKKKE